MPRKTKSAEDKSQASSKPDAPVPSKKTDKQIGKRTSKAKKTRKITSAGKKIAGTTAQLSALPQPEPPASADVSEDTIRLRAYFISERRRRFALPGDAESDWIEAKRQLLTEERC